MEEFAADFQGAADPRTGNAGRHELREIPTVALCTMLSGGASCADMALFGRARRDFRRAVLTHSHGVPRHRGWGGSPCLDMFSRMPRLPDPTPFRRCFPLAFMGDASPRRAGEESVMALHADVGLDPRRYCHTSGERPERR